MRGERVQDGCAIVRTRVNGIMVTVSWLDMFAAVRVPRVIMGG